MSYPLSMIDWNRLADQYNSLFKTNVSFTGSSASLSTTMSNGVKHFSLHITLYVKYASSETSTFITDESGNSYNLYFDDEGKLSYSPTRAGARPSINKQSIAVRNYHLLNILSDYVQPLILEQNL
jgi:hypothetical protein